MLLIPAIDLMNNQCVRLEQGDFAKKTLYSSSPVKTALAFQRQGFTHLHMVDLDGARKKEPVHFQTLDEVSGVADLHIDFSGGIRSYHQALTALQRGASAVTIGSLAVKKPAITSEIVRKLGPEKVILGADVKDGAITTAGWLEQSNQDLFAFLSYWQERGITTVMITDVAMDGMMQGPSLNLYERVLKMFPQIRLIASGGIATMNDIYRLRSLGCYGAITGRALYENTLDPGELSDYLLNTKM